MSSKGLIKLSSCWNCAKLAVTAGTRQMDSILVQYLNPRVSPDNWRKYADIINIHQGHMQYAVVCVKGVYMRWVRAQDVIPLGPLLPWELGKTSIPHSGPFLKPLSLDSHHPSRFSTLFFPLLLQFFWSVNLYFPCYFLPMVLTLHHHCPYYNSSSLTCSLFLFLLLAHGLRHI